MGMVHDEDIGLPLDEALAEALAAVEARERLRRRGDDAAAVGPPPAPAEAASPGADDAPDLDLGAEPPAGELELELELDAVEADPVAEAEARVAELEESLAAARARMAELEARLEAERRRSLEAVQHAAAVFRRLEAARARERELRERLEAARRRGAELRAELEAVARRRARERAEQARHGHAPALHELLPVLDHLDLALEHVAADPARVVEGLRIVRSQFLAALERLGARRVAAGPGTPFDPRLHEAVQHVESRDHPPGCIVEEIRAGYVLRGRLLRAARVTVSRGPGPASATAEE